MIPQDVLHRLRSQAIAPTCKPDMAGRRVVERKEETKKKIGRSPDDMDAVNLAHVPWDAEPIPQSPQAKPIERGPGLEGYRSAQDRRGWLKRAGSMGGGGAGLSRGYSRFNRGYSRDN
jgi:hypothetical protein